MRIYELAKEYDLSSKDLLSEVHALGIEANNHMSSLSEDEVVKVRAILEKTEEPPAEDPVPTSEESIEDVSTENSEQDEPESDQEQEEDVPRTIIVQGPVVVKDLADELDLKPNQLIAELMTLNIFASINQQIDVKTAKQLAQKHGVLLEQEKKKKTPPAELPKPEPEKQAKDIDRKAEPGPEITITRPPIVTFMGHVDHGKTSLLDRVRDANVVDGEAGGITQHIGAYTVEHLDEKITFLDTPGHAAFTAMRARGANLTDIAIVVVAADDGIMPQTREAIQHAKAAGVCIMVAINKIDLPGANVERVKRQLQQEDLASEDWGGETICCPVSAATGEGLEHFLEMLLLQSQMLEHTANPNKKAEGFVIEAKLESGMGPTATFLVRDGTLKVGDAVVCGNCWGKIKALIDDRGHKVRTAGPSAAVKCMGLTGVPEAGDKFVIYNSDKEARAIAEERLSSQRKDELSVSRSLTLESLMAQANTEDECTLNIILKADVKGSLEAIEHSVKLIDSEKVTINIVLTGVGNITENDVLLASASNAIIIGFHVSLEGGVRQVAKHKGVEIRLYSIIYELLDEVRAAMTGLLEPELREHIIGHAEVRQIFTIGKRGKVAGCMARDGRISSRAMARIMRDGDVIYDGKLVSLKRFQNDAAEIRTGQECGVRLNNFFDYEVNDVIEFYEVEKIEPEL